MYIYRYIFNICKNKILEGCTSQHTQLSYPRIMGSEINIIFPCLNCCNQPLLNQEMVLVAWEDSRYNPSEYPRSLPACTFLVRHTGENGIPKSWLNQLSLQTEEFTQTEFKLSLLLSFKSSLF